MTFSKYLAASCCILATFGAHSDEADSLTDINSLLDSKAHLESFNNTWEPLKGSSQYNLYVVGFNQVTRLTGLGNITQYTLASTNTYAKWEFQGTFASKKSCETIGDNIARVFFDNSSKGTESDEFYPELMTQFILTPYKCVLNGLRTPY